MTGYNANLSQSAEMKEAEFRTEVLSKAPPHLDSRAVDQALDFHVSDARVGRRYIADCIGLARWLADQRQDAQRTELGPMGVSVGDTDLTQFTAAEWIRLLTPRIEAERMAIWGSPSPPWTPDSWEVGCDWLREEERRGAAIRAAATQDPEISALIRQLESVATQLRQTVVGLDLRLQWPDRTVWLMSRGNDGWAPVIVRAHGSSHLLRISTLADEVGAATGFRRYEVAAWLLFGITPLLERVVVEWAPDAIVRVPGFLELSDGTAVPSSQTVWGKALRATFRTPDITLDDLRILREQLESMWRMTGEGQATDDRRFTDTDRALLTAWHRAGGPGRGEGFWDVVLSEWRALHEANPKTETNARGIPEPPTTSASVRRYFYRTMKKRPLLEHIPTTLEAYDG